MRDVFISHAGENSQLAVTLTEFLEKRGLTCWIAPRDIVGGAVFAEAILDGIDGSQAMVLVLSTHANASPFVINEVNRAFSKGKTIFTFRVEDILPGKSLELYLASYHWTVGFPPPASDKFDRLCDAIRALLGKEREAPRYSTRLEDAKAPPAGFGVRPLGGTPLDASVPEISAPSEANNVVAELEPKDVAGIPLALSKLEDYMHDLEKLTQVQLRERYPKSPYHGASCSGEIVVAQVRFQNHNDEGGPLELLGHIPGAARTLIFGITDSKEKVTAKRLSKGETIKISAKVLLLANYGSFTEAHNIERVAKPQ